MRSTALCVILLWYHVYVSKRTYLSGQSKTSLYRLQLSIQIIGPCSFRRPRGATPLSYSLALASGQFR